MNSNILQLLGYHSLTRELLVSSSSATITMVFIYIFLTLTIRLVILKAGAHFGFFKSHSEIFTETPVHCSHIYVCIQVCQSQLDGNSPVTLKELVYYIEFGPEDYEDVDLGTTLKFVRQRLLKLVMESSVFSSLDKKMQTLKGKQLQFYHRSRILNQDQEFLCNLGVCTGDTLVCKIDL
uniref:Uncharacterized protein n=1 Tax=Ogataea thermomethanolica (nom. inval.) TaxID=310468 RepID=A0A5P8D3S8_9ASCO|nr:hypothetical protein [Ogataea thermomethanolica (nom. inval.)]QGW56823.1 hypothetical protein [Ogataea thermomethanolica (nom. inval.)]